MGQSRPGRFTPPPHKKRALVPTGEAQDLSGRFGEEKNLLPKLGFETRIIQPLA